jgi:hypothetical protein
MAMKRHLKDDEIERQLKCKIRDVGLCFLGCLKKARFSYMKGKGGEAYIYIKKITKKKGMYIEFYYI